MACEKCFKEVKRRKTYRTADREMKVCDTCYIELSFLSYENLSQIILGVKTQ